MSRMDRTYEFLREWQALYSLTENALNAEEFKVSFTFIQRTNEELVEKQASIIDEREDDETKEDNDEANQEDFKQKMKAINLNQGILVLCLGELIRNNRNLFNEKFSEEILHYSLSHLEAQQRDLEESALFQPAAYSVGNLFEFFSPEHPEIEKLLDKTILTILDTCASHAEHDCRTEVNFPIMFFARNAKKETFMKYQDKKLEILKKTGKGSEAPNDEILATNADLGDDVQNASMKTKLTLDIIGAAYGDVLKYQMDTLHQNAFVNEWLKYLPLRLCQRKMEE